MNIFGTNVNKKGKREKNQKVQEGPCIFPFKHQWKEHDECIDNDDKGKICATSVSERGTLKTYGYCNEREKISVKSSSNHSTRKRNSRSKSKSNSSVKKGTKKKALNRPRTRKLKVVDKFTSKSPVILSQNTLTILNEETTTNNDIKIASRCKSMNKQLIDIMDELADIMSRQGEPFKSRAYKKAAETIISFPTDIADVEQLNDKPGIGKTIMDKLIEFQKTGTLKVIERERNNPLNVFTKIYGVGPKKAKQLVDDGITTLSQLKENESKLNDTQKIGLQYYQPLQQRIPRDEIEKFAQAFDTIFKEVSPGGSKYEIVGSYRREAQNSGDIDVIITNNDNNITAFNAFLDKLISDNIIIEVLTRGKTKSLTIGKLPSIMNENAIPRRIDILYTKPKEYAFATLYFTGSKAFNTVMRQRALDLGYTLNEHGLSKMVSGKKGELLTNDFPTEQSIFEFLGMKYKEPREREGYKSVELVAEPKVSVTSASPAVKVSVASKNNNNYKEDIEAFKKDGIDALFMLNERHLATILDESQKSYYNDSENVLMTDNEFDIIKEYMEKKYPKNKILEQIGAPIQDKNKVTLPYNMPSMDKIKPDTNALTKWKAKYSGSYVLSAKLDGISAMYSSENNEQKLYTRGNGTVGQDISHLIRYLRLPQTKDVSIRGELIMKKSTFLEKYADEFSNSRNLVAGIVNQKKVEADKFKDVDFVAYEVIKPTLKPSEQMDFLEKEAVDVVIHETLDDIDNTLLSNMLMNWRENYKYTIDGVIVSDDKIYERMDKNPEHGFAFKMVLSDQLAEAKVVNVLWSPSKDGYLKPRIQIEPVVLGGANIEYATAFNAAFVEDNKLGIGALIKLVRSGDVIPHIMSVVEPADKAKMPTVPYKWNDTHVDIIMEDAEQDDTVKEKNMVGFFKGLEVDGLGPGNVRKIMKAGYNSVPKIIAMTEADYLKVDGFKKKMAEKVYNSIHNKITTAPLSKIMAVSNIFGRGFGEKRIEPILEKYPNILKNITASSEEEKIKQIKSIRGMEQKTAERFVKNLPKFIEFMTVAKLESKLDDVPTEYTHPKDVTHILYDKSIIITGFRNKELSEELKRLGARESSAVSKSTFAVIVKHNDEDTGKAEAARQKNIPIYMVDEFKEKFDLTFSK